MVNSYTDANGVYSNKLGITDAAQLRRIEYDLTTQKSREILEQNVLGKPSNFGFERQQVIHQHLFEEVYDWAGKTRTVLSSKRMESGLVSVFANPDTFNQSWRELEKKTNAFATAKGLAFEQKHETLADIFIQANHIHPFPEGNGRSLQVFMKELARAQGIDLDYSKTNAKEWNLASGLSGKYGEVFTEGGSNYLDPHPSNPEPIKKIFADMATRQHPQVRGDLLA